MFYYERVDISEATDISQTSAKTEWIIFGIF